MRLAVGGRCRLFGRQHLTYLASSGKTLVTLPARLIRKFLVLSRKPNAIWQSRVLNIKNSLAILHIFTNDINYYSLYSTGIWM